jgi:hypothetical protein
MAAKLAINGFYRSLLAVVGRAGYLAAEPGFGKAGSNRAMATRSPKP